MTTESQLSFPFPSLDFEGRTTLTVREIAEKLGWTVKHICDLIDEGKIGSIDGRSTGARRASYRVPIESYHDWIITSFTLPRDRMRIMAHLPKSTLRSLRPIPYSIRPSSKSIKSGTLMISSVRSSHPMLPKASARNSRPAVVIPF